MPRELRDRAQQGRVLMINAGEDEVIPRACTEKLASALGIQEHVVWLDGLGTLYGPGGIAQGPETAVDFFAQDCLPTPGSRAVNAIAQSPRQKLVHLLQQCWSWRAEPAAGHCHLADFEVQATLKNGKPVQGRIRLVRGSKPKFSIRQNCPAWPISRSG